MKRSNDIEERARMLMDFFGSSEYRPMRFKDIAAILQVPKDSRDELRDVLDFLVAKGKIITDEKGRYRLPGDRLKTGIFSGTQKGYGFVIIEGESEDVFIPENAVKGAMHGDKVVIAVNDEKNGKRKEGAVL